MTATRTRNKGLTDRQTGDKPRLGFLGVGWIGRSRMESLIASGAGEVAAIADPDPELRDAAARAVADSAGSADAAHPAVAAGSAASEASDPALVEDLAALLELDLDGVVIATPSALHAEQSIVALEAGLSVFCQKPLGRDAGEAAAVVHTAEQSDRLLGVDFSYRFTDAVRAVKDQLDQGAVGDVYALDLTFHNAYGPDKPWFKQRDLAGGGCLVDLGTHLVDLALWLTGSADAEATSGHLRRAGAAIDSGSNDVEDFALGELRLSSGAIGRIACSWWLPAGRECVFEVAAYGTDGALSIANVGGSFYDFEARLQRGTTSELLVEPPDEWGGRALEAWARRLAQDNAFDPAADEFVAVSSALDAIYEAAR